jgi:hypothetical protein
MFAPVDTRVPHEVESEVHSICCKLFPDGDRSFVPRAFEWATTCFTGRHTGYQAIDAGYHDFEHTLQGTLCLARLLHGRHLAGGQPAMTQQMFELALLAILFHDTGYLKRDGDNEGTGAKYTLTHVSRSAEFARDFLAKKGYDEPSLLSVSNMIRCTGVNADLGAIPFQSELERTLGFALATADLLGQMAARDYVDKLPTLYLEFVEAARHSGERAGRFGAYKSAEELMRNTPTFWQGYVLPKINDDFQKLYLFLNDPYPDGPNQYLQRIQENLARLQRKLAENDADRQTV